MNAYRNLLAAMIERAVEDFRSGDRYPLDGHECGCPHGAHKRCPNPRTFAIEPAWRWLADASMEPWGFGWVCQHLEVSPESVRAKLWAGDDFSWCNLMARAPGDSATITTAVRAAMQ